MSDIETIIDKVLEAEGGYSNDPADPGGRTDKGVSEVAHPEAWADNQVTEEEARRIYLEKYVIGPGFQQIPDWHLAHQLVDFGVNSGPQTAIMKLQTILNVEVDGTLGPQTLGALKVRDIVQVGNFLVGERVRLIGRVVTRNKAQIAFLNGLLRRATEFLR